MAPMIDLSAYAETGAVEVRASDEVVSRIVLPNCVALRAEAPAGPRPGRLPVADYAESMAKRAFDLVVGLCILLFALPVLAAISLAIWIEDRGPVFFRQQRGGKDGRPFGFLKFRSMVLDAEAQKARLQRFNESQDGVIFNLRRDPRITRVGRFIRRTSLDELPQIFHVISGQMSLVGPRPHPIAEVEDYSREDRDRLAMKPGITCLWQIMGRSDLAFGQQMILDRLYIQHQTLWLDIKILAKTIPAVLLQRGAY